MPEPAMPFAAVLALMAVGGYLLGSIPFGVILTRLGGAGDVRQIGSGNIGATNVLRTGRRDLAIATLVLDAGKGAAALLLARWMIGGELAPAIAGGAAFLGHLFPVWLGFKGGKGVATFFGLLLAAVWPLGLIAAVAWLLTAFLFRFSSLAAMVAAFVAIVVCKLPLDLPGLPVSMPMWFMVLIAGVLIILRHDENIARLLKGTEPRIGAKSA